MNRILLVFSIILTFLVTQLHAQTGGVTIGTNKSPDKSAVLDLQATNKGFLPPRVTTQQRLYITNPAAGLIVFDTGTRQLFLFDGEEWLALTASKNKGTPLTKINMVNNPTNL